jgi:hypothetical protein
VVDIFGYFIAFEDVELNHKEFLNSKKMQKESEKQRSQVVVFKHAQDIQIKVHEDPAVLMLSWVVSDTKGTKILFRRGLTCDSVNALVYLKEFYQNLILVRLENN